MTAFTRLITLIALLSLAIPVTAHARGSDIEGTVAGWVRMVIRDDNDDPWACGIEKQGSDGTQIGAMASPDSFFLISISKSSWKLDRGASYPLAYSIDHGRRHATTGRSLGTSTVIFVPDDLETFIGSFYSGLRLNIHTAQKTFSVSLRGSAKSTLWMADCLDRLERQSRRNDPFSR